ncbi:condensation domain-containing protein [Streptomyces sp. Ru87]|uniref:condensation domain-containing protein n=1 Tax=Streptomyces sp. Ru87 TaxID=2044307 RepID=UPI000BF8F64A|nr:condensation domain-containing protein [Streptomyces sp. Ru87]PGH50537.1 hypothetical protein CRI70_11480 [Streptomyces sp. Ru87]
MTTGRPEIRHSTVRLYFTGLPGGTYEATWGQREMWRTIATHRPAGFYQLSQIIPVPADRTLDDVLEVVRRLVGRHESLRTTFVRHPGGRLSQVVHAEGSLPVHVREPAAADRERETAESLVDTFMADEPLLDRDFALRAAVVTREGLGRYLVLVCSHVVLDGHSERVLSGEAKALLAADPAARDGCLPANPHQPSGQALAETSARSRRTSARSVAYWRSVLLGAPESPFPYGPARGGGPVWCGRLSSASVAAAERELARSEGLSSGALYLSAVSRVLLRAFGRTAMMYRVPVSNRFDPAVDGYVGNLSQHTVVTVDASTGTFYELVRRVERDLLRACVHARYDPEELAGALPGIEARRGAAPELACLFNDLRSPEAKRRDGAPGREPPAPGAAAGVSPEGADGPDSQVTWSLLHARNSDIKLHARVAQSGDRPVVDIAADVSYLPRRAIADCLFAVERLLVRAARADIRLDAPGGSRVPGARQGPEAPEGPPAPQGPEAPEDGA